MDKAKLINLGISCVQAVLLFDFGWDHCKCVTCMCTTIADTSSTLQSNCLASTPATLCELPTIRVPNRSVVVSSRCFATRYLKLDMKDDPSFDPVPFFEKAIRYMKRCQKHSARMLVHCIAGVSRSVVLVLAFLVKEHHMRLDHAIQQVRVKH